MRDPDDVRDLGAAPHSLKCTLKQPLDIQRLNPLANQTIYSRHLNFTMYVGLGD